MKKVFAVLCAVLVMVCTVIPCFASNWEDETPEYSSVFVGNTTESAFLSIQMQVREIVEKATQLGLFGGAKPAFVAYYFPANSSQMRVCVGVPRATLGSSFAQDGLPKFTSYVMSSISPTANAKVVIATTSSSYAPWALYQLNANGDWTVANTYTASTTSYLQMTSGTIGSSTAQWKFVAYWGLGNNPRVWGKTGLFGAAYQTGWDESSTPTNATLTSIIARYDRAIEGTVEEIPEPEPSHPIYNYELDIARIFDGYFAGVRDTLGAFDINLFGINIIGVLIAFIVIAVVAFIVRKLWK